MKINKILNEATIEQAAKEYGSGVKKAANAIEAGEVITEEEPFGVIGEALDDALESAREANDFGEVSGVNVLLIGRGGTGKTSIVKKWARARGVNFVEKDAKTLDPSDLGGIIGRKYDDEGNPSNTVTKLSNNEFDELDKPNSVLFLDEMNRTDPDVVAAVLKLVLSHKVTDNNIQGGNKVLKGYLFTVAAINPAAEGVYDTAELDPAVLDRFDQMAVFPDITQYRKYLLNKLNKDLAIDTKDYEETGDEQILTDIMQTKGRINLANAILTDPLFEFDDIDDEIKARHTRQEGKYKILQTKTTSPRGFAALIEACDGTKDDLLNKWNRYCNFTKKDIIEQILTNYKDIDDKANDALKYKNGFLPDEEEESIFQDTAWDKLSGML